jgi:hypothetical protein
MHKAESFALSSGSKISKPFINQLYFPLVEDKYVCISKTSKFPSENYGFFDDVAFHINPYLEKNDIKIIQIGVANDSPIYYSKNYNFININQAAYVIRNSLLYIGNLNIYSNIASMFDVGVVCPSKISYVDSIKPYWSKPSDCKILQSNRKNFKPIFAPDETPKTINDIHPEKVAKAILDSLKIKNNLNKIKTLYTGSGYEAKTIEIIPNFVPEPNFPIEGILNVRVDKHFDVDNLMKIAQSKKVNIVTDQVIDKNTLKLIKENIESITFYINAETDPKEIDYLSQLGKPVKLLAKNLKNLQEMRVKFLDYDIIEVKEQSKSDTGIKSITPNTKFLSRKTVLSEGQVYNSNLSASLRQNNVSVLDNKDFWEDLDFMRIYEENP